MTTRCPDCHAEIDASDTTCPECGGQIGDQRVGARITAEGAQSEQPKASPSDRFREQMSAPAAASRDDDDDREDELWTGGFSPKAMIGWWVGAGLLTVLLVVGIIFFPVIWWLFLIAMALVWAWPACLLLYRRLALRYRLTTQRFIHERGVLTRVTDRIEVIDIDDVSFKQTLVDRIVGVGSITIESGDRTHPELVLAGIENVQKVYDMIDDARRKERVRRGIHIAHAGGGGGM